MVSGHAKQGGIEIVVLVEQIGTSYGSYYC